MNDEWVRKLVAQADRLAEDRLVRNARIAELEAENAALRTSNETLEALVVEMCRVVGVPIPVDALERVRNLVATHSAAGETP